MIGKTIGIGVALLLSAAQDLSAYSQGGKIELDRESSGLAFRMPWFESADEREPVAITRFIFRAGTPNPSQVIQESLSIYRSAKTETDDDGNLPMSHSEGRLEPDKSLDSSPTLIRHRLEIALGTPTIPDDARTVQSNIYYVFDHAMPGFAAQNYCELLGGHLVTIASAFEQSLGQELPETLNTGHRFWIDVVDSDFADRWEWVNGEELGYLNWATGHPDTTKPLWSLKTRLERREPQTNFAALGFAPNRCIDANGEQLKGLVGEWEP